MTTRLTELELELADAEAAYHAARHRLVSGGVHDEVPEVTRG